MNSDQSNLEANRRAFLGALYDLAGGTRRPAAISDLSPLGELSQSEAAALVPYLVDAELVESVGLAGEVQLTHAGVVEVEKLRADRSFGMDAKSWTRIDENFLAPHSVTRQSEDALAFIDGRRPRWGDCIPGTAPRRQAARRVFGEFLSAAAETGAVTPRFWVMLGATGEGKSTALMQVVVDIALRGEPFVVLWRKSAGTLSSAEVAKLPSGFTYLIASDDGEEIVSDVFNALRESDRADVHYLLAATTTEWQRASGSGFPWQSFSRFRIENFRGLEQSDAMLIVEEWEKYGEQGLRELDGISDREARAEALVRATRMEPSLGEGAFFGGMLRVRYGELLKDHLRDLMRKLVRRKQAEHVPYPMIYMLIAAAHSAGVLLTPEILALAAGIKVDTVRSIAIDPLSDEAVVTMAGGFVLTRHRLIAAASLELAEESRLSLPELYVGLVKAALTVGRDKRKHVEGYNEYVLLSRSFEKTRLDIAVAVAKVVAAEAPNLLANVHNLGHVLFLAKRYSECSTVYKSACSRLTEMRDANDVAGRMRRIYFFEWGLCEGRLENYSVSTWLVSVSIADLDGEGRSDLFVLDLIPQEHVERALTAIISNLLSVYEKTKKSEYLECANGAMTMVRKLELSGVAQTVMKTIENRISGVSLPVLSVNTAKLLFREAANLAYEAREFDMPAVPPGNQIRFTQLFARLGI